MGVEGLLAAFAHRVLEAANYPPPPPRRGGYREVADLRHALPAAHHRLHLRPGQRLTRVHQPGWPGVGSCPAGVAPPAKAPVQHPALDPRKQDAFTLRPACSNASGSRRAITVRSAAYPLSSLVCAPEV